ncbi:hypothetical protein BU24DRAFT_456136 [Aaosphaeria arxii CBS 175.79]|uniref:Uncharacterized protein n=1 Tax=Aaosphaeria arxii CBS 175.79 TaxID=1450172 RepID=A0A6A5X6N8_9PLEO|nr:uncharacterized protein BU24DRAFT_456136 [Aaosphaeria arxii CBS 175.79]KAF2008599.1 hypothetical protein BU24DRAFT_456136 [Aaosphaeria arxii CBS 175.79]
MGNWFGDLELAYKYIVIFLSLLVLAILAGIVKVLIVRRRLKKLTKKQQDEETGHINDPEEMDQRPRDEGDLFGVRAIEAGFYAGIPQSRPTSRAGSFVDSPAMSSQTLVGSIHSVKAKGHSHNDSAAGSIHSLRAQGHSYNDSTSTLPVPNTGRSNRDSEALGSNSPVQMKERPALRLAPSEAELSGRLNHSAITNMNLQAPPAPAVTRGPEMPGFGGLDDDQSDGEMSPRLKPDYYVPATPSTPFREALRGVVHSGESHKSLAGSLNIASPLSPGYSPETRLPTLPAKAYREEPRSYPDQRSASPEAQLLTLPATVYRAEPRSQSNHRSASPTSESTPPSTQAEQPLSPILLQPRTYQPNSTHYRDDSNASNFHSSANKSKTHRPKRSNSTDFSFNFAIPNAGLNLTTSSDHDDNRRPSLSSSLNVPGIPQPGQASESRLSGLSEFYDAYYRQSQLSIPAKEQMRPQHHNVVGSPIFEVDSALPSPAR